MANMHTPCERSTKSKGLLVAPNIFFKKTTPWVDLKNKRLLPNRMACLWSRYLAYGVPASGK